MKNLFKNPLYDRSLFRTHKFTSFLLLSLFMTTEASTSTEVLSQSFGLAEKILASNTIQYGSNAFITKAVMLRIKDGAVGFAY